MHKAKSDCSQSNLSFLFYAFVADWNNNIEHFNIGTENISDTYLHDRSGSNSMFVARQLEQKQEQFWRQIMFSRRNRILHNP